MSESGVSISFDICDHGWADIVLSAGGRTYRCLGASYTTDALGDLVRAALMIATGASQARASFDGEPAETRLILTSLFDSATRRGPVSIEILQFPDMAGQAPDADGDKAFIADCPALDFARAVLACAQAAKPSYDWEPYPFPETAVRALEAALA